MDWIKALSAATGGDVVAYSSCDRRNAWSAAAAAAAAARRPTRQPGAVVRTPGRR